MSQFFGANPNINQASLFTKLKPGFSETILGDLDLGFFQQQFAEQMPELEQMFSNYQVYGTGRRPSVDPGGGGVPGGGGGFGGGGGIGVGPGPGPGVFSPSIDFSPSWPDTPDPDSPDTDGSGGGGVGSPSPSTDGTSGTATDSDSNNEDTSEESTSSSSEPDPPESEDDTTDSRPESTSPSIGDSPGTDGGTDGGSPPEPSPGTPWPGKTDTSTSDDPPDPPTIYTPTPTPTPSDDSDPDPGPCISTGGGDVTPNVPTDWNDIDDCRECPCCGADPAPCCEDTFADCVSYSCLYHTITCCGYTYINVCNLGPGPGDPQEQPGDVSIQPGCCHGDAECTICVSTKYGVTVDLTGEGCIICITNPNCYGPFTANPPPKCTKCCDDGGGPILP